MSNINFYKLWHQDLTLDSQKDVPGTFINLDKINCPQGLEKLWPYLQEYRVHFADLDLSKDYVGFCSASLSDKFGAQTSELLKQRLQCEDYIGSDLSPIIASRKEWWQQAFMYHAGIDKYINHYFEKSNINPNYLSEVIFYCNSFICSKNTYLKARNIFQKNIYELFETFNYDLKFIDGGYGEIRKGGCLAERLWAATLRSNSKNFVSSISCVRWRNMVQ